MQAAAFHNRDRERRSLQSTLRSDRAELVIMYGRRGVGKSALLRQALLQEQMPFLYYRAVRRTLPLQLAALTETYRDAFPHVFLPQPFASTSVFLESLAHEARTRTESGNTMPVCAVIDELPYLADVDAGLLTELQHFWDDNKRLPNLKLFLCGSWLSFMERQVLDEQAPLYNRRTGAIKLMPMDYAEAALFFPSYSSEEKMALFAVLGGMPSYLEQFDPHRPLRDNILATILKPNTYLSQEPDWLLLEDLRRDVLHGSILRAVAQGERKPSDIARAIGKNAAQDIAPQLATLQERGLLWREIPITKKRQTRSRNSLYYIADNYLDFWYRFVDPARSLIAQEAGEIVWQRSVAPALNEYISRPAFERACRDFLWRTLRARALPSGLHFTEVGTWWGGGDIEIDVVAVDERNVVTAAGSCKWTNEPVGLHEYDTLRRDLARAGLAQDGVFYYLFSRSGFREPLLRLAESQETERLFLISLDALYAV